MFAGFTEETVRFFLDLRFHNNSTYFHENHDRYLQVVQKPFYELINELAPTLKEIDPGMELRPHKCLSRINRDVRFSKDKSPYRDHLWIAFRRAAEQKDGSVNFYFEYGPTHIGWGMGTWGENKLMNERFRREIAADPHRISAIIDSCDLAGRHMAMYGSHWKKIEIPPNVPERLIPWYTMRDIYLTRTDLKHEWGFSERVLQEVRRDYQAMAPIYKLLRGIQDDLLAEERAAASKDEW